MKQNWRFSTPRSHSAPPIIHSSARPRSATAREKIGRTCDRNSRDPGLLSMIHVATYYQQLTTPNYRSIISGFASFILPWGARLLSS